MQLQLAKAKKVARAWGIPERRLREWLDAGVVQSRAQDRGRGSVRLLTAGSLADAFLAQQLSHDLPLSRVRACLKAARPLYAQVLRRPWAAVQVVFQWHHHDHEVSFRVVMDQCLRAIGRLDAAPDANRVDRGRPPRGWQDEFGQLAAEIGRELRAAEATLPPLDKTIRSYRARRRAVKEVRVTVPA